MKFLALALCFATLTACAANSPDVKPDETTEQFVSRVINSSGGAVGY